MVVALPALALLAGLIVAWGLIYMGRAFVDALFGILKVVLKWSGGGLLFRAGAWALGKVGVEVVDPVSRAHQWLSDKLGAAADAIGASIAMSWHALEVIVRETGWAMSQLAIAVDRLRAFMTDRESFARIITSTAAFSLAVKQLATNVTTVIDRTQTIIRSIAEPVASPIGAAVKVVTRVDRAAVANLRAWTIAKVHALEAAIAHAGTVALPYPGSALADLEGALGKLRRRVGTLERGAVGAIAAGALTFALARLGAGWLRCSNVSRLGKGACRLDPLQLDELLTGTLAVLSPLSIVALAEELAAVTEDIADVVLYFAGGEGEAS